MRKIGKDGKDGWVKLGVVAVIKGVVVWVVGRAPGRPVALTLGPPLNLPLGGGGRWLAGEGTRCCGRGGCGEGRVGCLGGNGVLCFSLDSRVRGNDVAGVLR